MSDTVLISVLMTAYNRQQFIAEAIESVINSTYNHWELIIVDDGSKDQTVEIAETYRQKDSRIRLYVNEKNLGDYPNRNRAASYAKGGYLLYVDSDDTLRPDTLEMLAMVVHQFPQLKFASYTPLKITEPVLMDAAASIRKHFFETPVLMHGPVAMFINKSFFEELKGFPEKYGPANDMYFNLKAAVSTGVLALPFELVNYRRHEGQEINDHYAYLFNNYCYLEDALSELDLPLSASEKRYLHYKNKRRFSVNLLRYFLTTGNFKSSRMAIQKAGFSFGDFLQGIFHVTAKPIA